MRNSNKNKQIDFRRYWLSGEHGKLYRLFNQLYPEYDWHNLDWEMPDVHLHDKKFKEWLASYVGKDVANTNGGWNAPSHFRRLRTRLHRSVEKQTIRESLSNNDLDVVLPKPRKDAGWLWW